MARNAILMDGTDDVATALTLLKPGDEVEVELDGHALRVVVREEVPFGHKIALRDVEVDEEVLKYGLPIGRAMARISAGDWVHVHNCRSSRFGYRHEQYGVNA